MLPAKHCTTRIPAGPAQHPRLPPRLPRCATSGQPAGQPQPQAEHNAPSSPPSSGPQPACSTRRQQLLAVAGAALAGVLVLPAAAPRPAAAAAVDALTDGQFSRLQEAALEAYANRDFAGAIRALDAIIADDARNPQWYEMRAQAKVDGKDFRAALDDYSRCVALTPPGAGMARVVVGRALALEGLGDWAAALEDYNTALVYAAELGLGPDPYVLNSRGNCYNSLGLWAEARQDYLDSAQLFQQARGFRGRNGSTTQRLDGAIFAASNAALMLAQLGDEGEAVKEMTRIARRAPGSVDMRAALAALYWSRGQQQEAEAQWEFACDQITVGCRKYADETWLRAIRRWPPVMVAKMQQFLQLQTTATRGLTASAI